jgi:hypothetical protein
VWLLAGIGARNRLTTLRWTTTDPEGRYALNGIPRGLSPAQLCFFAEPPDGRTFYGAVASGRFQGTDSGTGVGFEPMERDQDPLNLQLKLETR